MSHSAFTDLNQQVVNAYYAHYRDLKTWRGHRVCAIDGSQIRLPDEPDIVEEFGVNPGTANKKDCPLALASAYYDVLNHVSIDSSINHTGASERECAASHLRYALPNDLSILDRGYNAFWLFALYAERNLHFCMRAKINRGKEYKQFADSGKDQKIITLSPNKRSVQQCRDKGLPTGALTLRLIRIELESEVEVLITNLLDEKEYPANEFKELYHLRWGIEENYKRLKQWVEIENFSGKSALSVKQDFYAKALTSNLASMMASAAQKQVERTRAGRKNHYRVNFAQALSKMKNAVVQLLRLSTQLLRKRLGVLIDYIACTIEPVRTGRCYQRPKSRKQNRKYYCPYKRSM